MLSSVEWDHPNCLSSSKSPILFQWISGMVVEVLLKRLTIYLYEVWEKHNRTGSITHMTFLSPTPLWLLAWSLSCQAFHHSECILSLHLHCYTSCKKCIPDLFFHLDTVYNDELGARIFFPAHYNLLLCGRKELRK